jgi:carbon storage regulator CsrA
MLCITRKVGESITIVLPSGERITVGILRRRRGGTTLMLDAPRSLRVFRTEKEIKEWSK